MKYKIILIICLFKCLSYTLAQNQSIVKTDQQDYVNKTVSIYKPDENSLDRYARTTGGKLARPKQFPYQVGLSLQHANGSRFWCGGTLISKDWVLTAAHCLVGKVNATIFLGALDLRKNESEQIRMISTLESFRSHELYNNKTSENDIALIKLPRPAPLSDSIEICNLPDPNMEIEGLTGVVSGWGKVNDAATLKTNLLNYVELKILPLSYCGKIYKIILPPTLICVDGSNQKSACKGDSGGPLVVFQNNSRSVIGVSSFGKRGGCQKEFPTLFVRIQLYLDWIKKHISI